jgi:hypothetical protein
VGGYTGPAMAADWPAARDRRVAELDETQGAGQNASTQHFLSTVAMSARERRLFHFAYIAQRP